MVKKILHLILLVVLSSCVEATVSQSKKNETKSNSLSSSKNVFKLKL